MKLFVILFLMSTGFLFDFSARRDFNYSVEVVNGGPDGFSHVACYCNSLTKQFTAKYSDPGYEKYSNCCESTLPKEVNELIEECDRIISLGRDTSGMLKGKRYQLEFAITDNYNFKYTITSVK